MQFSRDRNPTPDSSNLRISCLPQHPLIDLNTLSDVIPTTLDSNTPRIVHELYCSLYLLGSKKT